MKCERNVNSGNNSEFGAILERARIVFYILAATQVFVATLTAKTVWLMHNP
jgi:hypothetical protein